MATRRTARISEVIRKELSLLLQREVELEGVLITISAVEIAPDLREAYIYISILQTNTDPDTILFLLEKKKKVWQQVIGKKLPMKYTPHLNFKFDETVERGDRIMQILAEIDREKEPEPPRDSESKQ
jgi:ribosome-binding factor A